MVAIPERLRAAIADRYTVERELGQGGMATVYLAHDVRHRRPVALKVLRPELAAVIGAERFLAEIRTTANLQHPHILPLHDSGEADSFLFYVMPFVEGESLRARIVREKQLGVADAVKLATQVAAALDYAHRHGVIHRDIKPENILLHEDQALVADFGIALAVSQAGTRLTETGLSLGTPHYMSPEQALGERDLTPRSDVYALGTVLHEMLAGEPPFTGPTAQAVVSKLLSDAPTPLRRHRPAVPEAVEAAVLTALEKLPADRFAGANDFAAALRGGPATVVRPHATRAGPTRALGRRPVWLGAAIVAALLGIAGWLRPAKDVPDGRTVRFSVLLPPGYMISANYAAPTFSSDGSRLVLPGTRGAARQLFLVTLSDGEPRPIPGTANARAAAFSPDGRWLAFIGDGKLRKVELDGGSPIVLADAEGLGVAWDDDGGIVYNRKYNEGLMRIGEAGGTPQPLTSPREGELGHWWPQTLPGGAVLFTAYGGSVDAARIASFKNGARKDIVEGAAYGRYVPSGRLLFLRARNIMAVSFDPRALDVKGAPEPVLQHVAVDRFTAQPLFAVSGLGDIAWVPDSLYLAPRRLVWLTRAGKETPAVPEAAIYSDPRLSPDGRRIAVTIEEESLDLWVLDLASGIRTPLTRSPGGEMFPLWTPDGRRVVYQGENEAFDIYSRAADGSDSARLLLTTGFDKNPTSVSPDGRLLAMMEDSLRQRILLLPLDSAGPAGPPREFLRGAYHQESPMISPDGRWLAFASSESGRMQVVVAPLDPAAGPRRQVTQGGIAPVDDYSWLRWSAKGDELLYATGDSVMGLAFDSRTGAAGTPRLVLRSPHTFADLAPDGRLLALRMEAESAPRRFDVVLGWPTLRKPPRGS